MAQLDDKQPKAGSLRKRLRPSIQKRLEEMWEHEPEARRFDDPEGVHQMRVATRKVRAALDAGSIAFSGKRYRQVRKEVRALTKALGAVRDPDVMLEALDTVQHDAEDGARPGVQRLIDRLVRDRDVARERLLRVLDRVETEDFRQTSLEMVRASGEKRRLRRKEAAFLIADHVRRFNELTASLPDEHEVEELHEVRIATKKLRYALQLAKKPLHPESTAIIRDLKMLQDEMGEIHNLDVLIALAREELHRLADEEIGLALSGESAATEAMAAARADLIALLSSRASDRSRRYGDLRARHDRLQANGFAAKLSALATPTT